ncbi:MAG: polysaccharide pyruvyl transferase WcaK-like protein [Bradymonadia bacterium]|jgi:polysaccharide pyruvyl transferase WcaK-like protein
MTSMRGVLNAASLRYAVGDDVNRWQEGDPLKLMLAGYVGTRNTGADVRVEEMIRQIRHVLGPKNTQMTVVSNDLKLSAGYFGGCHQVHLPAAFPGFLFKECPNHHGVIACEGSMFKSKFSNALTAFMAGALGMANAEHKLSVGYGAEAGEMSRDMSRFVEKACAKSLVMCRNKPSRGVLERLGVRTTMGTDTAWTFEPAPESVGIALLEKAGWDGKKPVMAVCPINPFWWPVKPDLVKAVARKTAKEFDYEHYRAFYFHAWDDEREAQLTTYLQGIADAVNRFRQTHDVFPILVGMERLDRDAAERLNPMLDEQAPLFISDDYQMYELVSVLRRCKMLVSSRYHAIVTSMPGLVPSGGITMDERIRNLMVDRGHPELFVEFDDPNLADRTYDMLVKLHDDGEEVSDGIARALPRQLELMGQMGIDFADEVRRVYPNFPLPDRGRNPELYLPSPGRELVAALERAA